MMRSITFTSAMLIALAMGASACTEKPQVAGAHDYNTPAYQGAKDPYVVPGWKVGDATSWEKQMTHRARHQDEYNHIGAN